MAVFVALDVLVTVMAFVAEQATVTLGAIAAWIVTIVYVYLAAGVARSFTEVRADGIGIQGRRRRRDIPWTEVASISDLWMDGRSRAVWYIVVTTSAGERVRLPAPTGVDENFRGPFQRIVARWKAATSGR